MIRQSLKTIDLFADLPDEDLMEVERRCLWRHFAPGDKVLDRDGDDLDVYFVVTGKVRILNVAAQDRDVALADIPAGNYFGELAAIDGLPRSARVVAIEDSLLASLDGPDFLDIMRRHPAIPLRVLERLTRIVRDLDKRVTQISIQTESQRIWTQLLRFAEPTPDGAHWLIPQMPYHKEIAAWSGTSREDVARAIGDLARQGIVKRRTQGLVIHDLPRLQQMARQGVTWGD